MRSGASPAAAQEQPCRVRLLVNITGGPASLPQVSVLSIAMLKAAGLTLAQPHEGEPDAAVTVGYRTVPTGSSYTDRRTHYSGARVEGYIAIQYGLVEDRAEFSGEEEAPSEVHSGQWRKPEHAPFAQALRRSDFVAAFCRLTASSLGVVETAALGGALGHVEGRSRAIERLVAIGGPAVPVLVARLRSADFRLRQAAADGLVGIGADAIDPLLDAIREAPPLLRQRAAQVLARTHCPDAVGRLDPLLREPHAGIRQTAAWILGQKGGERVRERLRSVAATDESPRVQREARKALEDLTRAFARRQAASDKGAAARGRWPAAGGAAPGGTPSSPQNGADDAPVGCFIATACYGSADHPHVATLRQIRDRWLLHGRWGRTLVAAYYRLSPPLAASLARRPCLRAVVRCCVIRPLILALQVAHTLAGANTLEQERPPRR